MAKVSELPGILNGIADKLEADKAAIIAEIATLKASLDGDISAETQASIARLQGLADDLHTIDGTAPAAPVTVAPATT